MAQHNRHLIEYILPAEPPQEDEDFIEFYSQFNLMLTPLAFGLSYYRNRDLKWAAIHTLLAAPYVAYVMVNVLSGEETKELIKSQPVEQE
jgi:hypothetical protein